MITNGDIKRNIVGQITANETTEVTTTLNNLSADSVVMFSLNTVGGTPAAQPYLSTKTVSTGVIGMKAGAGDTSTYDIVVFQ